MRRPDLSRSLSDAEFLQRGTLLRRHGYLFEVTRLAPGLGVAAAPLALLYGEQGLRKSTLAIRAWPWVHGTSGETAFLVTAAGTCLRPPDSAPRWHGLQSAGASVDELEGWRAVP
jgi:hypothetical protein